MNISTNNMKLNLSKARVTEKDEKWIEQDIIVPDNMPDAIKIISITSIPYISDIDISNGRVKVVGKINYFVIYMANDEKMNTRGLNVSYPYTTTLEKNNIKNKEDINMDCKLKNIIFSLPNERKFSVKSEVTFDIDCIENVNIDIVKDFPNDKDIEFSKCKNSFNNIKERRRSLISSSDDIMLSRDSAPIYEILKINSKIKDTEYKDSYNKIMLKGILAIDLVYLGQENSVHSENLEVPFSSMVELSNMSDNTQYKIDYYLRDLNLKINPDIEQKTLNIDYKVESNVTVFEKEEVEYIDDFYSKTRDLAYDVKNIDILANEYDVQKEITINDSISDIISQENRIVEYDLDTSGVNIILENDSIRVSGIAKLNLLIQNKDTMEMDSKSIDIMVEQEIPIDENWKDSNINIKITDTKLNVIQNGNGIDIKVIIYVKINVENTLTMNSIDTIQDQPIDLNNISSINIYIVKTGDSIWKIAKKYKTSMDNILKINNIENPNMIDIGQKILIIR